MTPTQLQQWLVAHGQPVVVDGIAGPQTRAAILAAFACRFPEPIADEAIAALAERLGCTVRQLRAVAIVESSGAAFDRHGRPKMLFEQHLFWRATGGRHGVTAFSNPDPGGYGTDSWAKLTAAASVDPAAAFASASWGKFQVLGQHWAILRYSSPLDLAFSTVGGEAGHYELLARYVARFGLLEALRALSPRPDDNRPFARGYNGPGYERFAYHLKLARALA